MILKSTHLDSKGSLPKAFRCCVDYFKLDYLIGLASRSLLGKPLMSIAVLFTLPL